MGMIKGGGGGVEISPLCNGTWSIQVLFRGSGWPTSLRRWYTMLALPLSGLSPGSSNYKKGIGKTPAQNVPQWSKEDTNNTGRSQCILRGE